MAKPNVEFIVLVLPNTIYTARDQRFFHKSEYTIDFNVFSRLQEHYHATAQPTYYYAFGVI